MCLFERFSSATRAEYIQSLWRDGLSLYNCKRKSQLSLKTDRFSSSSLFFFFLLYFFISSVLSLFTSSLLHPFLSSLLSSVVSFLLIDKSSRVHYASIDYACARDAMVCVITIGSQSYEDQQPADYLDHNLKMFKDVIPNVCKYAPNSVLLILSKPGTSCCRTFNAFFIRNYANMTSPFSKQTAVACALRKRYLVFVAIVT